MSQFTKEDARNWLQTVVSKHLGKTARHYKFLSYTNAANHTNAFGMQVDLQPQEGKVMEVSDDWVLVKLGRAAEFFVCQRDLLELVPGVGATVRITPYARRRFDGRRLDAPDQTRMENGLMCQTFTIGETRSPLPIDKAGLQCEQLKQMIDQVEELKAPDGVRRLCQVLVDAGADKGPVDYKDPSDQDIIKIPPTLRFRIHTRKHLGYLDIEYDRSMDLYSVRLVEQGSFETLKLIENVDFSSLPEIIVDLVDDGQWRIAKVEVLKPAPKQKLAA